MHVLCDDIVSLTTVTLTPNNFPNSRFQLCEILLEMFVLYTGLHILTTVHLKGKLILTSKIHICFSIKNCGLIENNRDKFSLLWSLSMYMGTFQWKSPMCVYLCCH